MVRSEGQEGVVTGSAARSAATLSVLRVAARLAALVRQVLIARIFGATGKTDAYFIAFQLFNMLSLFFGAGLTQAMVTTALLDAEVKGGAAAAKRLLASLVGDLVLVGGTLIVLLCATASLWIPVVAPGLAAQSKESLTGLTLYMLPAALVSGAFFILAAALHAKRSFVVPEIAALTITVAVIAALVAFHKSMGIYSLGLGHVLGALCAVAVVAAALIQKGFRPIGRPTFRDPQVGGLAAQCALAVAFNAAAQAFRVFERFLASFLPAGKITALSLAQMIVGATVYLFVQPLFVVVHPSISETSSAGRTDALAAQLEEVARFGLYLFIPAAFGLFVMAKPVVYVLLRQGRFSLAAAADTAAAIKILAIGFVFQGFSIFLGRVLAAVWDTKSLATTGSAVWLAAMAADVVMLRIFGFLGLVATFAAAFAALDLVFILRLRRRVRIRLKPIAGLVAKSIFAAAAVAAVVALCANQIDFNVVGFGAKATRLAMLALLAAAAAVAYWTITSLLSVPEARKLGAIISKALS